MLNTIVLVFVSVFDINMHIWFKSKNINILWFKSSASADVLS